ncbi:MAG: putative permease [Actinomycetia bacterium]|nr:putative permease [Actinomycetes bacterium]
MIASISTPLQVGGCLLVGVVTGVLSGMFGIGGAVVSTPAIRALGATPLQGVGSTLPSIFPSSITGTLRYHRDGYVRWNVVRWTGGFGIASSVAGSLLAAKVPGGGHVLMIVTAALVAYTAYRTAFPHVAVPVAVAMPAADGVDVVVEAPAPRLEWWRLGIIGFAAGGLSGLLGVGGGILMVPAFSGWARLGLKETIATSLAVVGILAIPGTITHALLGHIAWRFAIPLSIGVIPGARIGAHLTIQTSERRLRIAVGTMLGLISLIYAAGEILAL